MFVARNHKGLLCNALEEQIEKGTGFVCPACLWGRSGLKK